MQKFIAFEDAFTDHSIFKPVLSLSMLFEVIIDAPNINVPILICYLNWTHGIIAIPDSSDSAILSQEASLAPFSARPPKTNELLATRLAHNTRAFVLALKPLALIDPSRRVEAWAYPMSSITLDLANIFSFSLPSSFHLAASLPKTQEILTVVPEVKTFPVKEIILKVTVVILTFGEYW